METVENLEAEFLRYQMAALKKDSISLKRLDSQWSKLSKLKDNEGKQLYGSLSNFMWKLLVHPHRNAARECIVSVIKTNKTTFRSLMVISIFLSILIVKSAINNAFYTQQYDAAFLKKSQLVM